MRSNILLAIVSSLGLMAPGAVAQYPVTYQGRLADAGLPVDGNVEMVFAIYDAPTGGTLLDFVQLPSVPVADGYFTANLDFASPQLFVSDGRWLEIRVRPSGGVETVLDPRQEIRPVPRSFQSEYDLHSVSVIPPLQATSAPGFPGDVTLSLESGFVQRLDALETLVGDQAALIAALQTQMAALLATVDALSSDVGEVQDRVSAVEGITDAMELTTLDGYPSLVVEGVNFHLRNGMGDTNTDNGTGNLIVGYNELRQSGGVPSGNLRTGSHNVVLGREQNYSGSSGILSGFRNDYHADYGAILGGMTNEAYGLASVVVGGDLNIAGNPSDLNDSFFSVVVSGHNNNAQGRSAAILAGQNNSTFSDFSTILAGNGNQTFGVRSAIVGGFSSQNNGRDAVIVGGGIQSLGTFGTNADGEAATIVGGYRNEATGTYAVAVGGYLNKSSNTYTVVTSGLSREATGTGEWVSSSYGASDWP